MSPEELEIEELLRGTFASRADEVSFDAEHWTAIAAGTAATGTATMGSAAMPGAGGAAGGAAAGSGAGATALAATSLGLVGLAAAAVVVVAMSSDNGEGGSAAPPPPSSTSTSGGTTSAASSEAPASSTSESSSRVSSTSVDPTALPTLTAGPLLTIDGSAKQPAPSGSASLVLPFSTPPSLTPPPVGPTVPSSSPSSTRPSPTATPPSASLTWTSSSSTPPSPTSTQPSASLTWTSLSTTLPSPTTTQPSPSPTSTELSPSPTSTTGPVDATIVVSAGEPGRAGVLCFLLGECREVVAEFSGVPAGDYTLRVTSWRSGVPVRSGTRTITLDGHDTTLGTGYFVSTQSDQVVVALFDRAGALVATSGRIPW